MTEFSESLARSTALSHRGFPSPKICVQIPARLLQIDLACSNTDLPVHSNRKTHIKEPRLPRADASSPFQTPVALLLPSANPGVGKAFMVISWNRLLFSIWQQILTRGCDYTTAATPGQFPPAKLWDSATWSLFAGSDCGFLRPSLTLRPPGGTGAGQTQG